MPIETHDTVPTQAGQERFAELIERAGKNKQRIVLTRDGEPVAAIVPMEDLEALDSLEDAHWTQVSQQELEHWKAEGHPAGLLLENIAEELGIDLDAGSDSAP